MRNKETKKNIEVKKIEPKAAPARRMTSPFDLRNRMFDRTPFRLMPHFAEEMENMLTAFGYNRGFPQMSVFDNPFEFEGNDFLSKFSPPVEMLERDGKLIVRTDLPGLEKDDIKIELKDNFLIIEGERKQEEEESSEDFFRSECTYGSFFRRLPLPENVKTEGATARFKNGVLEVTLAAPKMVKSGKRLVIKDDRAETKTASSGG